MTQVPQKQVFDNSKSAIGQSSNNKNGTNVASLPTIFLPEFSQEQGTLNNKQNDDNKVNFPGLDFLAQVSVCSESADENQNKNSSQVSNEINDNNNNLIGEY